MALSLPLPTPQSKPKFVQRLDSQHKCCHCGQVVRNAMQTSCGHRVCEECVEDIFAGKEEPVRCPAGETDCDDLNRADVGTLAHLKNV